MTTPRERILIVEDDPEIGDLLTRQTLQPMGYQTQLVGAVSVAIREAVRFSPDVILTNLHLPDLSGKDLLVALSAQGIEVPTIVIAEKGMEGDVIQAFRLGAADYLYWPVREAEVVSAVERVLTQVRARREREMLARQVKQANQELQRRVRELTTIFALGKAVTSITDQRVLLDKIVEGAIFVTEADSGWLLLREDRSKSYLLGASRNLPRSIAEKVNQPWDDGISSLVALSGESLAIHGEPLKRFKVSSLGQSALVVPVKARKEVIGLLVVIRKAPLPFGPNNQALLEAVADYASISLVNARLFKALEERAHTLEQAVKSAQISERIMNEIIRSASHEMQALLEIAIGQVNLLLGEQRRNLSGEQTKALRIAQENLKYLDDLVETAAGIRQTETPWQKTIIDLSDLARHAVTQFQRVAHQNGVILLAELPSDPVLVHASSAQMMNVFESLISNAIKYNKQGGQVSVRVVRTDEAGIAYGQVSVKDTGIGIDRKHLPHLFDHSYQIEHSDKPRFGGLGIGISLASEIVLSHGGKLWVESEPDRGSTFHFSLPISG